MIEVFSLVAIFWLPVLIVLIKKYLWDLYFWQIKEYRWDRFWTHIRWDLDEHNRNYYNIGVKFILFSTTVLLFDSPLLGLIGIVLSYIIWTFESFEYIADLIGGKVIKPALKNIRNILIMILLSSISLVIPYIVALPFAAIERDLSGVDTITEYFTSFSGSSVDILIPDVFILIGFLTLLGLFMDLASPFIVPIGVFVTWPFARLKRRMTINKAKAKFDLIRDRITLIGITGSQGKTTTKELLYEILKSKYRVAKTPENYNTDVGIASAILSEINEKTEIFIAEMGAYRKGEIKSMVKNFTPDISIITDIDTQHIGIFGGRENLKNAKSEIVRYMKTNGLAILNGDSDACRDVATELQNFVTLVSSEKENFKKLDRIEGPKKKYIKAEDIKSTKDSLHFTVRDNDQSYDLKLGDFGKHLVNNILISLAAASKLDMSLNEAASALEKSKIKLPRLVVETGDNNTLVLNDSYSSSFKGFIAAVKYMNEIKPKGKRIVITRGILELGREKKTVYKDLVHKIRKEIDILITNDPVLLDTFKHENSSVELVKVKNSEEMIYKFREFAQPEDVILLEGRLNPKVIKAVVSDKM